MLVYDVFQEAVENREHKSRVSCAFCHEFLDELLQRIFMKKSARNANPMALSSQMAIETCFRAPYM